MANSVDPDQTAPIGAVCSGSTLFASILNSSVMLGNSLQQTTSEIQGATASSHIPPPLLQDPRPCLQLLRAECHALCQ